MPLNPPTGVEYLPPLLALITIAISVPLVLRKVPPNLFYGVRTRKTLSNPRIWYEANYQGGMALIAAALVALLGWAVLLLLWGRNAAGFGGIALLVGAMLMASVACLVQLRKL